MTLVSAVIPCYNAARYLGEAVESVLEQTHREIEVIVVDDGSRDETPEVVAGFGERVRAVRQENAGVSVARNRGIEESRGEYVAFLDADDRWLPGKIERQLAALAEVPGAGACYTAYWLADAGLRRLSARGCPPDGDTLSALLLQGNVVGTPSTVLARRDLLLATGGFDPELSTGADWDMWIRLARSTGFAYVEEPQVLYRTHDGNMSRSVPLLERDSVRLLENALDDPRTPAALRRRASAVRARNWQVLAGSYLHARLLPDCLRCMVRALLADPRECAHLARFPWRRLLRFTR